MNIKQKRKAYYRYLCDKLSIFYRLHGIIGIPTVEAEQIVSSMHDMAIQRAYKRKDLRCYSY